MSNAPRVAGFKEISFWQEDGIGVITILSDDQGRVSLLFFEEFLKAISLAITDDKVRAVAITGSNDNFLTGLRKFESVQSVRYLDMVSTVASFIAMINKPVFSLVNGTCKDLGVELTLLSDVCIAREGANFSISESYTPVMGLSRTIMKYPIFVNGESKEGKNCDIIFPQEIFLDKANDFILTNIMEYMSIARRERLGDINVILSKERSIYLTKYLMENQDFREKA
jgi:hypothetical protein